MRVQQRDPEAVSGKALNLFRCARVVEECIWLVVSGDRFVGKYVATITQAQDCGEDSIYHGMPVTVRTAFSVRVRQLTAAKAEQYACDTLEAARGQRAMAIEKHCPHSTTTRPSAQQCFANGGRMR